MLTAHNLRKAYDTNLVLDQVTFSLNAGQIAGLIGPNGCGKTTLMRILAGLEKPDAGHVSLNPGSLRIGYLAQGFAARRGQTLGELLDEARGSPAELTGRLAHLAARLADHPEDLALQNAYDAALRQIEILDPAQGVRQTSILEGLGLAALSPDTPAALLSGGQKTRLGLALVLLSQPRLLLLDEPTNHLDIAMLEWLESWLVAYTTRQDRAALIISHDRVFLDRTVTSILDLNPETHWIREYPGSYSDYVEQVSAESARQMAAYQDQVYEIRRMRQDIARTKQQSLHVELTTTSRQPGVRRIAKKVARKAKSREKKLERFLEAPDRVEKPKLGWLMRLEFNHDEHHGQDVLTAEGLSIGYPGCAALLEGIGFSMRHGERVALTGPNGGGKTTLLRTIAGLLEPKGGALRLGSSVRLGYMAQEQDLLDPSLSALEHLQQISALSETEARSFLHFFLFSGDDALRPAGELSYGERARLSLALIVQQGSNFLLLDEPINHLDIPSRERFEQALAHFEGSILAVVHDRYFIERFATRLLEIRDGLMVEH
jgi:ATP-binding cassette subfamily F protein 3